ncbi:MAG: tRNA (adenosine(37)-N6)-dimethylallyltransferase MiaA [Ignavibacteriaceae bacterium]|nr:tRNA (adenosine(37)-N6)-dimethylallyltransferase MiaA [Ignavibacteriaceae bacterium]
MSDYNLLTVLGTTATGKTRFAVEIAGRFNGEILSADSRQVYRNMNLGTGKDLDEYETAGGSVPYHLIDIAEPVEDYNLFRFVNDFKSAYQDIISRGRLPVLCGGTGLYINAVISGYRLSAVNQDESRQELEQLSHQELIDLLNSLDHSLHNTTDITDRDRTLQAVRIKLAERESAAPFIKADCRSLNIGLRLERSEVRERITGRLKNRLDAGMVDEVKSLMNHGISVERLKYFGLEYKFIGMYLSGEINYNDMFQKLNAAIHDFAKRQETWFRRMERNGIVIHWFSPFQTEEAAAFIRKEYFG